MAACLEKPRPCLICGKPSERGTSHWTEHGYLPLCSPKCRDILTLRLHGSYPAVWFSVDDIGEHESCHQEILDKTSEEVQIILASKAADHIWDDNYIAEKFGEVCASIGENLEEDFIKDLKDVEVPLYGRLYGELKSEGGKKALAKRLKGDTE